MRATRCEHRIRLATRGEAVERATRVSPEEERPPEVKPWREPPKWTREEDGHQRQSRRMSHQRWTQKKKGQSTNQPTLSRTRVQQPTNGSAEQAKEAWGCGWPTSGQPTNPRWYEMQQPKNGSTDGPQGDMGEADQQTGQPTNPTDQLTNPIKRYEGVQQEGNWQPRNPRWYEDVATNERVNCLNLRSANRPYDGGPGWSGPWVTHALK